MEFASGAIRFPWRRTAYRKQNAAYGVLCLPVRLPVNGYMQKTVEKNEYFPLCFSVAPACEKKHMACRENYKPYILKYKALILKYMAYIFRCVKCL